MPTIDTYQSKEFVAAGTIWSISLASTTFPCKDYYIWSNGVLTLSASCSVAPSGTPLDGMKCVIHYSAKCNLAGNAITIFGVALNQEQALSDCRIEARYDATLAVWVTSVFIADNDLPQSNDGVNIYTLAAAGTTHTLVAGIDKKVQEVVGSGVTLSASHAWVGGGTPVQGDEFWVHYKTTTVTLAGNTITIFGKQLTALQATAGNCIVYAYYNGTTWVSILLDGYGIDKFRVLASSGDTAPTFLDGKVKNSVEVDGDQMQLVNDQSAPGINMMYGTNSSGTKEWIPIPIGVFLTQEATFADAEVKTLNTVPYEIVPNPGIGYSIEVIKMTTSLRGTGGTPTPYATNTKLQALTDTATTEQFLDSVILLSTVDRINPRGTSTALAGTTDTSVIPNKALFIKVSDDNPTAGNAANVLKVSVTYRIINI